MQDLESQQSTAGQSQTTLHYASGTENLVTDWKSPLSFGIIYKADFFNKGWVLAASSHPLNLFSQVKFLRNFLQDQKIYFPTKCTVNTVSMIAHSVGSLHLNGIDINRNIQWKFKESMKFRWVHGIFRGGERPHNLKASAFCKWREWASRK